MTKTKILSFLGVSVFTACMAATAFAEIVKSESERQAYEIIVDENGVMRRGDTGEETSYYGVNYTMPFAHAYRAAGYLGLDRKEIIDRDVYHFKRLGLNAFRLHLWEAELADSAGNLLSNDHLDLLDYLMAALEKEGIDVILTAQTSFGNGYPEKNIDTGSFAYDFDKCHIHEDPTAQAIQENYLKQLVGHVNPYTGRSYADDRAIIALEINNEPCHSGTKEEVTAYINRMKDAIRDAGFDRIVLYNVTHNPDVTEAYYDADIQGTTYQWYPTGLVAGHERKGNFLPYVSDYPIPWDTLPNFNKMAKVVYEFDPGDVLASYLYPAVARTFRKQGFQWATQFAYDPTPLAPYNTEYQTHFLNLLYTPSKAISMAVAAEAMKEIPRGSDFGEFPQDTLFGNFRVSYPQNLSEYNTHDTFIYSNSTSTLPKNPKTLKRIAGVGSSPVVEYTGSGAYFLDKTDLPGVWRLEVMPDVAILSDPFEKPSLRKEVVRLYSGENDIKLNLPALGENFSYQAVSEGNTTAGNTKNGTFKVIPGVYLLAKSQKELDKATVAPSIDRRFAAAPISNEKRGNTRENSTFISHNPLANIKGDQEITVEAEVFSDVPVDSVQLYTSYVSFWSDRNPIFNLENKGNRKYTVTLPANLTGNDEFRYNLVAFTSEGPVTFPDGIDGTPLSWDYPGGGFYTTQLIKEGDPIVLYYPQRDDNRLETAVIPGNWHFHTGVDAKSPDKLPMFRVAIPETNTDTIVLKRFVGDYLRGNTNLSDATSLNIISDNENVEFIEVALTGKDGVTYSAPLSKAVKKIQNGIVNYIISLDRFQPASTLVVPAPYPVMLPREVKTQGGNQLKPEEIESFEIRILPYSGPRDMGFGAIWLSK